MLWSVLFRRAFPHGTLELQGRDYCHRFLPCEPRFPIQRALAETFLYHCKWTSIRELISAVLTEFSEHRTFLNFYPGPLRCFQIPLLSAMQSILWLSLTVHWCIEGGKITFQFIETLAHSAVVLFCFLYLFYQNPICSSSPCRSYDLCGRTHAFNMYSQYYFDIVIVVNGPKALLTADSNMLSVNLGINLYLPA